MPAHAPVSTLTVPPPRTLGQVREAPASLSPPAPGPPAPRRPRHLLSTSQAHSPPSQPPLQAGPQRVLFSWMSPKLSQNRTPQQGPNPFPQHPEPHGHLIEAGSQHITTQYMTDGGCETAHLLTHVLTLSPSHMHVRQQMLSHVISSSSLPAARQHSRSRCTDGTLLLSPQPWPSLVAHLPFGPGSRRPSPTAAAPGGTGPPCSLVGRPRLSCAGRQAFLGQEDSVRVYWNISCAEKDDTRLEKGWEATGGSSGMWVEEPRQPASRLIFIQTFLIAGSVTSKGHSPVMPPVR